LSRAEAAQCPDLAGAIVGADQLDEVHLELLFRSTLVPLDGGLPDGLAHPLDLPVVRVRKF
jgi:hypothetical protein